MSLGEKVKTNGFVIHLKGRDVENPEGVIAYIWNDGKVSVDFKEVVPAGLVIKFPAYQIVRLTK